jgi:hypothetical protein
MFAYCPDYQRKTEMVGGEQLSKAEQARYHTIDRDNLDFIMNRYNRANRWVIADMLRRSRYRFPDKPALIFGDKTLTYSALDDECNKVANSLMELGVKRYDPQSRAVLRGTAQNPQRQDPKKRYARGLQESFRMRKIMFFPDRLQDFSCHRL